MKITIKEQVTQDVVTDIICDLCGQSCASEYGHESMELKAVWGFNSKKDMEVWEADICEKCVDEKLGFINFKKTAWIQG